MMPVGNHAEVFYAAIGARYNRANRHFPLCVSVRPAHGVTPGSETVVGPESFD